MKKITIILFSMLFILSSCYSNPDDLAKIKELEKTAQENTINLTKIKELEKTVQENTIFKKNIECKNLESNIKKELAKYDFEDMINEINDLWYSAKLNSCIYSTSITYNVKGEILTNHRIINYFTWENLKYKQCKVIEMIKCQKEIKEQFLNYIK
jgi:hypothetical protein